MGATVGKILSMKRAMKAGIGTASVKIGKGVVVGALVAVNAFGDVIDPDTGQIVAGARKLMTFADTRQVMKSFVGRTLLNFASGNTVIGVVATNANLTKEQTTRVAQMAHNGLVRTIRPATTLLDGDTVFALSKGEKEIDLNIVGAFAAQVYAQAILNGVQAAEKAGGLPAAADIS
jgi:L-aminopeptidase/D-esterase-like protein